MAFFTLMWSGIAVSGLNDAWSNTVLFIFVPLSLIVAANGAHLFVVSKNFPSLSTKSDKAQRKRMGIAYGVVFSAEAIFIGAGAGILGGLHKDAYIIPVIALIVGLHFYPMAKVFRRTLDYYLATWVCLAALIGVWQTREGISTQAVSAMVGLATASATTVYGLYMWRIKHQALVELKHS